MKTLVLTVGLPRSGKSTWAKQQGFPIVNRDSIRLALHGQAYIQEAEDAVTMIEKYMVKSLFLAGHDTVIIDATNLKFIYRKGWYDLMKDMPVEGQVQLKEVNTPKEVCIQRAIDGNREDLVPVIERMAEDILTEL